MSACVCVRACGCVWVCVGGCMYTPLVSLPHTHNHNHRIEPLKQQVVRHIAVWSGRRQRRDGGQQDFSAFLNRLCVVLAALAVQVSRLGSLGWPVMWVDGSV